MSIDKSDGFMAAEIFCSTDNDIHPALKRTVGLLQALATRMAMEPQLSGLFDEGGAFL
jgi:hypothetical protein